MKKMLKVCTLVVFAGLVFTGCPKSEPTTPPGDGPTTGTETTMTPPIEAVL